MVDTDKDDLHPTELSRCCIARVRVVVHGPHDRHTDYICTKCERLCDRYTKVGGAADPWPPQSVLALVGMTREEWNRLTEGMERRHIPWDWLIESAAKRIIRRRQNELAKR